jgi:hypothetical protein
MDLTCGSLIIGKTKHTYFKAITHNLRSLSLIKCYTNEGYSAGIHSLQVLLKDDMILFIS